MTWARTLTTARPQEQRSIYAQRLASRQQRRLQQQRTRNAWRYAQWIHRAGMALSRSEAARIASTARWSRRSGLGGDTSARTE